MARLKENIYVIQKFVKATSVAHALSREKKGTIVDICLSIAPENQGRVPAVGFMLKPDGKEDIDYE